MKNLYFERDDKLGRLEYAEFLKTIITNSDQYKRDLLTNAYTIAVDSPWGTGKSYFFNMFMNYCRGYEGQNYSRDGELNRMKIVYYNAWENDFWDNPFEPIMNIILEEGLFDDQIKIENDDAAVNSFVSVVKKVAYVFAKTQVKKYCSEEVADIVEGGAASLKKHLFVENNLFKEFRDFRDSITNLKQMLSKYISYSDKKLVVIVDELDRCKPLFAIQTLEIVKHLFDVKDMVFVFAIDITQLSCSIRTVYGQDMDSTGYLCRFFDYISKIPKTDSSNIISGMLSNIKWNNQHQGDGGLIKGLDIFFTYMQAYFKLTLRDLDTVLKSYMLLYDVFLKFYTEIIAHYNYIYFLIMKYKKSSLYNSIIIDQSETDQENERLRLIKDYEYYEGISGIVIILELSNSIIQDLLDNDTGRDISIGKILFNPDYKKIENIKSCTYGEYISHNLEMFNFENESED